MKLEVTRTHRPQANGLYPSEPTSMCENADCQMNGPDNFEPTELMIHTVDWRNKILWPLCATILVSIQLCLGPILFGRTYKAFLRADSPVATQLGEKRKNTQQQVQRRCRGGARIDIGLSAGSRQKIWGAVDLQRNSVVNYQGWYYLDKSRCAAKTSYPASAGECTCK